MKLPSETVSNPCHHVMPAAISPEASVYVVITIDRPTHSAARWYVPHVRRSTPVGARSLFDRCDSSIALMLSPTSIERCGHLTARRGGPAPRGQVRRVRYASYGVVVDSVNVSVLEYEPVRRASLAPIAWLKPSVTASLEIGAAHVSRFSGEALEPTLL